MISISICMIVKNEETMLARCLNSVRKIADEIVIVDTGSRDKTPEIARQFTDRVYSFDWIDDFSAARNLSFSKATKDYIMWLDADDIINDDNRDKFVQLKESLSPDTDVVMLPYLNADNPSFTYYRERIVRRESNPLWKEPVHEHLTIRGNVIQFEAAVIHNPGKRDESHGERNLRIYRNRLNSGETLTTRGTYYYARELKAHRHWEEAATQYRAALQKPDIWVEDAIAACGDLSDCELRTGQGSRALNTLFSSFAYDLPRAEILCKIGAFYLKNRAYFKAIYWYSLALEAPVPKKSWGFTFSDYYDYIPHMQMCVLYDRVGEREKAFAHHEAAKKIRPDNPAVVYNDDYFAKLRSLTPKISTEFSPQGEQSPPLGRMC